LRHFWTFDPRSKLIKIEDPRINMVFIENGSIPDKIEVFEPSTLEKVSIALKILILEIGPKNKGGDV